MKPRPSIAIAAAISLTILPSAGVQLEIDAGALARDHSIVTFDPGDAMGGADALKMTDGVILPLFKTHSGKAGFIAPPMPAGTKLLLTPEKNPGMPERVVELRRDGSRQDFVSGGKVIAGFQDEARTNPRPDLDPRFLRGGYLHPLFTPSGKAVTDDYALNHLHHHGIWMAWTKAAVDGRETDFWNMGQGKGRVDFSRYAETRTNRDQAAIISHQTYTDLTSGSPVDVLDEKWTVSVYRPAVTYNVIDLEAEQVTLDGKTLELPIYHYGGLGIRGREEWNGKDKATFITSENLTDRNKANSQPARWISMTGAVEGGTATLTILSHPENFRSPQPVRIHPNEPFISFAPQTKEGMSIKPGETYKARYRFIVSDGGADAKLIEQLWQDYAHPVTTTWKK
ncbi:PmoA family protein [Luteolibacter sp. SL250]|uniref:DUF6807 domain-containing protein n=1 Tax=Luteolibacter sp. SL250 TaxID=2995170 RepID=UPI0022700A3E|nr:PmoA family protein [Luteolibacter sp. SL250]WAC21035.1 PmoA family protein [Luteolibacter sp. SL250]